MNSFIRINLDSSVPILKWALICVCCLFHFWDLDLKCFGDCCHKIIIIEIVFMS